MASYLITALIVAQVLSALAIIVLVLLQQGKGADMGAAFGGGASGSLFGATGSANFLSRTTAGAATLFFLATLGLAYVSTMGSTPASSDRGGVMSTIEKGSAPPAKDIPKDVPSPSTGPATTAPGPTEAPKTTPAPADLPK